MKIVISEITDEGLDLDYEETIGTEALTLTVPARVTLRIEKVSSEVFVKGTVRANVALQCSRCLGKFSKEMEVGVSVVYHPLEELKNEEKHEIKDDELDMGFYQGDELDVQELITEQILLNVPMKPLCSESCRGLCPKCGTDLNVRSCNCGLRETDPRLEILKKLLDEGKE
ncbi:MAG: DUF177 domain-containing protein [Nitrospirae bacterium]|nr:DUF177 domain-containing protein [Nitrospirota bacterium]